MVPWTQLREPPLWGKCLTDLTFEFTHFILVIRLSKVKQPAFLFCTVLQCPAVPVVPGMPRQISCLSAWSRAEHPETSFAAISQRQCIISRMKYKAGTWLAGVVFFFWWLSGEVKHVVHLIRWNSYSCFMPSWLTWLPSQQGNNARPLGFGTDSCFNFLLFHQPNPHWSLISCVLPSLGRLAPSRAEVFVGFRCVRLVQALSSLPPSAGLVPFPSTLRFSFFLALSGFARSGPGVSCWCSLFLFLRSPLRVLLSNFSSHLHDHLTFIPPSSSSSFHNCLRAPPCRRQGVCVCVCVPSEQT